MVNSYKQRPGEAFVVMPCKTTLPLGFWHSCTKSLLLHILHILVQLSIVIVLSMSCCCCCCCTDFKNSSTGPKFHSRFKLRCDSSATRQLWPTPVGPTCCATNRKYFWKNKLCWQMTVVSGFGWLCPWVLRPGCMYHRLYSFLRCS